MDNNIDIQLNQEISQPTESKMVFNTIFSILALCNSLIYLVLLFSAIGLIVDPIFIRQTSQGVVLTIIESFVFVLSAATGITLIKKMKIGYKLSIAYNITFCITAGITLLIGSYLIFTGLTGSGEYDVLELVIGIPVVIASLIPITYHLLSLRYYKKRKHLFVN